MQYTPRITPNGFQYVHHMLIYLCNAFNDTEVGTSAPCFGTTGASVSECRQGSLIAGWAVGGTVSTSIQFTNAHSITHLNYYTMLGGLFPKPNCINMHMLSMISLFSSLL